MAKKRPRVSLAPQIKPQTGAMEELFSTADDVAQAAGIKIMAIRLDAIKPDPTQPRQTFPPESLQELSDSIRQDGVIQPIEVTQSGEKQYLIVHGERRWRAAQLAGLETIPAVIRPGNYDPKTRFVRQIVENIQREDLNDVDRASALLHLKELLQKELDEQKSTGEAPWSSQITWAKVGKRLGYSRQRIHQLIQLLRLPEEIKNAIRDGVLSERETRVYQGLKQKHQKDLHVARTEGSLNNNELKKVAKYLKEQPSKSVPAAIKAIRTPAEPVPATTSSSALRNRPNFGEGSIIPARSGGPTNIDRLDYIRGHLARIQRQGITASERTELIRLLQLIEQDVTSLLQAIDQD